MSKRLFVDFNATSPEQKFVLGVTLHGVPLSWNLDDIIYKISLFMSLKESKNVSFISMFRENCDIDDGSCDFDNKVHLLCYSLESKIALLKMRVIPFSGNECGIIVIRPIKSIFRLKDVEMIYTIPEYGNVDVAVEMIETMKLLDENNISLKYAILIAINMLKDHCSWDMHRVNEIWSVLTSNTLVTEMMSKLIETVKKHKIPKFKPTSRLNKYSIADIFDTNTMKWIWEKNLNVDNKNIQNKPYYNSENIFENANNYIIYNDNYEFNDTDNYNYINNDNCTKEKNCNILDDEIFDEKAKNDEYGTKMKNKKLKVHTGCIRFEKNRNRWVVDMTLYGFRSQKCFHVSYYGLIGGLQAARKWRYDYISRMNKKILPSMEKKVFKDLWDKIHMMDQKLWPILEKAVIKPIEGYEEAHNCINVKEFMRNLSNNIPTMSL